MSPRMRRLQADYDDLREAFSGHDHVIIEPVGSGRPPESYRVSFRVRGLYLYGDQPDFRDLHELEIMLPRHYPAEKPYVVPITPVFHPNVRDYYCIADFWAAGMTLADVIVKLGDMIQWKDYNVRSPLDAIAAKWAAENEAQGLFPIGRVDLGVADFAIALKSRDDASDADESAEGVHRIETPSSLPAVPHPAAEVASVPQMTNDDDFVVTLRDH